MMANTVQLLVVMDPIEQIKFEKDTTLAMLLAAQARGWSLHYAELADLRLRDGVAEAHARALTVRADAGDWYTLGAAQTRPLGEIDVVLMRKDLRHLHPRTCRTGRRTGGESAARPA
jgi:glutathione synthase